MTELPGPIIDDQIPATGVADDQVVSSQVRSRRGELVLVATPIGNLGDISARAIETLRDADIICCEDTRHTGQLLKRLDIDVKQLISLHAHNEAQRADDVVVRIRSGEVIALVSDAGSPVISDPGYRLVSRVIDEGLSITTVPGPSAVIAALCVAGLPAERFCFEGFLPRKGSERRSRLEHIAQSSSTSVIYESPLRVSKTLVELADLCGADRRVAVVRELTKMYEETWRGTLGEAIARTNPTERGEHVIVVGPVSVAESTQASEFSDEFRRLRTAGLSRRDAASALEILLGISHRDAYQAALEMDKDGK
jgi:16S rRNA (cytidine1402-2'-O)-methyltransferase